MLELVVENLEESKDLGELVSFRWVKTVSPHYSNALIRKEIVNHEFVEEELIDAVLAVVESQDVEERYSNAGLLKVFA